MKDSVHILGTRGSTPVSGPEYLRFGGATSCYLVCLDDTCIVLDAGTGLCALPEEACSRHTLDLILTHPHIDHLLGLPLCPFLYRDNTCLNIYAKTRGGLGAEDQVRSLFSPPLWPVSPSQVPAEIRFSDLSSSLQCGPVRIDSMEGIHPGGISLLRLTGSAHSVVLISDCTLTEELLPRAAEFARGCDLLLCDGQYSEEEWAARSSFGHSTWTDAARFGIRCGAKAMRIIHHDPSRTDAQLIKAEQNIQGLFSACSFAREGEVITL